jgi:tetratricopeptide (TPR) repeat protein
MCLTATIECLSGTSAAADRADALLAKAQVWGELSHHPNIQEELHSARATCALMLGRLRDVIEPAAMADEIYSKKSALDDTGDYYTMFAVRTMHVGALQALGRHKQAIPELRELIASARATDNVTTILQISMCVTVMEHVLERCVGSRERLDWERARLPTVGTGILHVMHVAAVLRAATTTRDFAWGQEVLDALWPSIEGSPVTRSAYVSYLLHVNLARFLLNRHIVCAEQGDPRRTLRRCLRFLSSEAPEPLRKPSVLRIEARLAYLRGETARARELYRESITQHQTVGAEDDVARERYALACLTDGAEGENDRRVALQALASCGVVDPESDLPVYYPELFLPANG